MRIHVNSTSDTCPGTYLQEYLVAGVIYLDGSPVSKSHIAGVQLSSDTHIVGLNQAASHARHFVIW